MLNILYKGKKMNKNDILTEMAVVQSYIDKFKLNEDKDSKESVIELKEQMDELIVLLYECNTDNDKN